MKSDVDWRANCLRVQKHLQAVMIKQNAVRKLVAEQAEDEGLWFSACSCSEAYLQQALRGLHALVESNDMAPNEAKSDIRQLEYRVMQERCYEAESELHKRNQQIADSEMNVLKACDALEAANQEIERLRLERDEAKEQFDTHVVWASQENEKLVKAVNEARAKFQHGADYRVGLNAWGCQHALDAMDAALAPAAGPEGAAMQELVDQAQKLDMGYGALQERAEEKPCPHSRCEYNGQWVCLDCGVTLK